MPRYAGIKNNNICVVSDVKFKNDDFNIIELSSDFDDVSLKDLISDYKYQNNNIVKKHKDGKSKDLKIAFVSNWKMRCGISTYAEFLYPEIIKDVSDFKIFAEYNDIPTGDLNQIGDTLYEDKVVPCWKRGESAANLIKEIRKYDPDIILIQHEFGLWSNARSWISLMNQLSNYRVIVTMHSVFHHKDKTICEAAIPEIVVHLDGAKKVLKEEKGVPANVHVIPHGCFPCVDKTRLWNFYKSNHTVVQMGYLFKYKAWQNVIEAVALLKDKYPDVFFTGLCSESPFNKHEHQLYYNELMELIDRFGVQENVGLIRGYQSDQSLDSYLRTNKVAIFPYVSSPEHEVFGASGAARMAMSKNIPVISTSVNHFSDLPTIKADSPEQMAIELDKLFSNNSLVKEQLEIQNKYLENNSWKNIARKYLDLFETKNI